MAFLTRALSYSETTTSIGSRFPGGVSMIDMSFNPMRDIYKVRGIGVAVRVNTSTNVFIFFNFSLSFTPKRCSSSITTSPRSLNLMFFLNIACVPITMSTVPPWRPFNVSETSPFVLKRQISSTFIGKSCILSLNVM